ncbi:unnamed protein product [Calicophoron daubneyi]|uniref:Large ribosomal subunit protein uL4m n=1 Tax=Calicophoron daubneyi TaxID=300641 RepID=A0AAV2TGY9_CALDB
MIRHIWFSAVKAKWPASSLTYMSNKCRTSSRKHELPNTDIVGTSVGLEHLPFEVPLLTGRTLGPRVYCSSNSIPRQAWLETLKPVAVPGSSAPYAPVGLLDLHPDIFAVFPRLDLVHKNLYWQAHYRMVDWRCITTRAELPYRSNRKPWPQKGTGRARHGNRRTHIWVGGGQCKGPRGPESFFSVLPRDVRLNGLLTMLTVKHSQDDLHIVDNLDLSESLEQQAKAIVQEALTSEADALSLDDPVSAVSRVRAYRLTKAMNESATYLRQLVDNRRWGPSVLFVTDESVDSVLPIPSPGEHSRIDSSKVLDLSEASSLAIHLACSAYAHHVEAEISPEASAFQFEDPAPRASHPGRGLTLMPLHGLNVWSLVHHDTVVLTLNCLEKLESRLLEALTMVVRDESVDSVALKPMPGDWLPPIERGEFEDNKDTDVPSSRHFSEPIGSEYWQKVKLS